MDNSNKVETHRRSPYLRCCHGVVVVNGTLIKTALLSAVLILLIAFAILVLAGALYASSVFFFVSASVLLSAAAMLTLFYFWLNRKKTLLRMQYPSKTPGKTEISTLSGSNYYSQVPSGQKSDFPMGPYLVMTLPRTNNYRGRSGTLDSECSIPNTPKQTKKKSVRRCKNLPPLASAETLTPSLLSSCYGSIDSVV